VNTTDADRVEQAIKLAVRFHSGQRDKAGEPYLLHLFRVASQSNDPVIQQAALLHDLLEDTSAKREDLIEAGISPEAIEAVELLTHNLEESYANYILKINTNEVAKQVKLLDINDNYRLDRVAYRSEHQQEDSKRIQKYILSKQYLTQEILAEDYIKLMPNLER